MPDWLAPTGLVEGWFGSRRALKKMDSTTFAAGGKANKLRKRLFKVRRPRAARTQLVLGLANSILWADNPESIPKVIG